MFSRQQHRRIQISSPLGKLSDSLQVKQEVVGAIHFKGLAPSPLKDQGANGRIQDCLIIHPQLWHKLGEPIFQAFPALIDALRAGHAGKNIRVFHPGARSSQHFVADRPMFQAKFPAKGRPRGIPVRENDRLSLGCAHLGQKSTCAYLGLALRWWPAARHCNLDQSQPSSSKTRSVETLKQENLRLIFDGYVTSTGAWMG